MNLILLPYRVVLTVIYVACAIVLLVLVLAAGLTFWCSAMTILFGSFFAEVTVLHMLGSIPLGIAAYFAVTKLPLWMIPLSRLYLRLGLRPAYQHVA